MYSNQAFLLPDPTPPPIPYPLFKKQAATQRGSTENIIHSTDAESKTHKQKISETEMPNKAAEDQVPQPPPPQKINPNLFSVGIHYWAWGLPWSYYT